jgi:hypothetical protein
MINFIRQQFCSHEIELVEDYEWVHIHPMADQIYHEKRKYMFCKKCGWKKKVSKR